MLQRPLGLAVALPLAVLTAAGSVVAASCSLPVRTVAEPAPILVGAEPPPADPAPAPEPSAARPPVPEPPPEDDAPAKTLRDQRRALFHTMETRLDLTPPQLAAVEHVFDGSLFLGQGNPALTQYGMKRSECHRIRVEAGLHSEAHPPCDRVNMVPLFNPQAGETAADARVCIDQFEFPDIACEYPVVHVTAREAAELCAAEGKRICDAHEWEGACAGALRPPELEYAFDAPRPLATWRHNHDREVIWAYGPHKDHTRCATGTDKTAGCPGGGWAQCGSNTYPSGSFPECVSPFGVYDQHGNAAEHMNLPLSMDELASRGGTGSTEMKGSWFVFQRQEAHEDDCRWRAKDWHPSKLMAATSHSNYHLGFRCCADVDTASEGD
jgi:formylglycine-generating enzyme